MLTSRARLRYYSLKQRRDMLFYPCVRATTVLELLVCRQDDSCGPLGESSATISSVFDLLDELQVTTQR